MNYLGNLAGSHHGTPDLFERDIKLLLDYQKWVKTVRESGYTQYTDWTPSHIDMLKSRLFWRIRSGKEPLSSPPPTCYSCPWYELIEVPGPHDVWEVIRVYSTDEGYNKPTAYVAQSAYNVIEQDPDFLILEKNGYKFKAWNGMIPTKSLAKDFEGKSTCVDTQHPGSWIEYIGRV